MSYITIYFNNFIFIDNLDLKVIKEIWIETKKLLKIDIYKKLKKTLNNFY